MTVREWIEVLSRLDPDEHVFVTYEGVTRLPDADDIFVAHGAVVVDAEGECERDRITPYLVNKD